VEDKGSEGLFINLKGDKIGMLIGRRGETLDAIQHITNFAVNHGLDAAFILM
jgi:spoIIIJ-associated protein